MEHLQLQNLINSSEFLSAFLIIKQTFLFEFVGNFVWNIVYLFSYFFYFLKPTIYGFYTLIPDF